jgi:hypothetical protein
MTLFRCQTNHRSWRSFFTHVNLDNEIHGRTQRCSKFRHYRIWGAEKMVYGGKSAGRRLSEWSESDKSGQMLGRTVVRVFGNLGRYEPRLICTYVWTVCICKRRLHGAKYEYNVISYDINSSSRNTPLRIWETLSRFNIKASPCTWFLSYKPRCEGRYSLSRKL